MSEFRGVNFENLRIFLYHIHFGRLEDAVEDKNAYNQKKKYIIPMRDEYENPSSFDEGDTYIQYFILRDKMLNNSAINYNANETLKEARIAIRFVGKEAENWAKRLHHANTRKDIQANFQEDCNGIILPSIGDIVPKQVRFFGTVTSIGFDIILNTAYTEVLDLDFDRLTKIKMASGIIKK